MYVSHGRGQQALQLLLLGYRACTRCNTRVLLAVRRDLAANVSNVSNVPSQGIVTRHASPSPSLQGTRHALTRPPALYACRVPCALPGTGR